MMMGTDNGHWSLETRDGKTGFLWWHQWHQLMCHNLISSWVFYLLPGPGPGPDLLYLITCVTFVTFVSHVSVLAGQFHIFNSNIHWGISWNFANFHRYFPLFCFEIFYFGFIDFITSSPPPLVILSFKVYHGSRSSVDNVSSSGLCCFVITHVMQCPTWQITIITEFYKVIPLIN